MAQQGLAGAASFTAAKQAHMRDMRAAMFVAVDRAGDLLYSEMQTLTSRIDHDLEDLRRMGHPYRRKAPQGIPHPDWIVHIQGGDLKEGLGRLPIQMSKGQIQVQIVSRARHTWYLLLGTRLMRPRDFVSAAMINREDEVERIIGQAFMAALGGDPRQFPLKWTHIPHPTYPAQLPGG